MVGTAVGIWLHITAIYDKPKYDVLMEGSAKYVANAISNFSPGRK